MSRADGKEYRCKHEARSNLMADKLCFEQGPGRECISRPVEQIPQYTPYVPTLISLFSDAMTVPGG